MRQVWQFSMTMSAILFAGFLSGCGSQENTTTDSNTSQNDASTSSNEDLTPKRQTDTDSDRAIPASTFESSQCKVITADPGWTVFIDGYPIPLDDGEFLTTPCTVEAGVGSHTVTVAHQGMADASRQIQFSDEAEVWFDDTVLMSGESELLNAPYLKLPVGRAVPLNSLNTLGKEFDPFVTKDGRSIWFAADRSEGRGIYFATRSSPLYPFDPPQFVRLTGSADQATSPSITDDELMVVYAISSKGRLRGLARSTPVADFDAPSILASDDDFDARYPAAQVLGTGDRIYFTRVAKTLRETRVVFKESALDLGTPTFSTPRIVTFPGVRPCLSSDGLRQYFLEGRSLRRSERNSINAPFGPSREIANVELSNFRASEDYRQYFVTADEQWLFYTDDPFGGGDLWMLRLANGPAWGAKLQGSALDPNELIAQAKPSMEPAIPPDEQPFDPTQIVPPAEPVEEPEPIDPRSLPLPYVSYRESLSTASEIRNYAAAKAILVSAENDPKLSGSAEEIAWDREELEQVETFYATIEEAMQNLPVGEKIRFGSVGVEFVKFADGVVTARTKTKQIERPITEFSSAELLSITGDYLSLDDPERAKMAALYLIYSGDTTSSKVSRFLDDAGDHGKLIAERLAARALAIAVLEFDRNNYSAGFTQLDLIATDFQSTETAVQAELLRESLYTRTVWKEVGNRNWGQGEFGEWAADDTRVEGALLVSPEPYQQFTLQMEYKTTSTTGQGGVYFRYTGNGRLDRNALKIHLANDAGINPDTFSTGALFNLDAPTSNMAKPAGEWNSFEMNVAGKRVTVKINGKQVLNTTFSEQNYEGGLIALDGVIGGISYRKVILAGSIE